MSARTLLAALLRYKAWADRELVDVLAARGHELPEAVFEIALRLLDHLHVIDRLFVANLQRERHGCTTTSSPGRPDPRALFAALADTDAWLVAHVDGLAEDALAEEIDFAFTDGRAGRMSREEMLGHLVAHGGYHRGEVGQLLTQHLGDSPPDTFTGYLRRFEPRCGGRPAAS